MDLGAVTLRSLSWTQIVPKELGDGRIVFELADTGGGDYLKDTASPPQPISTLFTQDALSAVGRAVNAPFRLHAVFQPNLADPQNTPLLDPLALDDITVLYDRGGVGVSSRQEGE